jgi:hypothetical protein
VKRGRVELVVGNSSADGDLTLRKTIEVDAMLTIAK